MDERPMTGMLDEDAIRAGAVRVYTVFNTDATTTIEWTDINGNTIRRERIERAFCFGGWDTSDCEEEPDIKAERGGALDEFLDEFKPQTTQERSDEQK